MGGGVGTVGGVVVEGCELRTKMLLVCAAEAEAEQ